MADDCFIKYCPRLCSLSHRLLASWEQKEEQISIPAMISCYLGVTGTCYVRNQFEIRLSFRRSNGRFWISWHVCQLDGCSSKRDRVGGLPGILAIKQKHGYLSSSQ